MRQGGDSRPQSPFPIPILWTLLIYMGPGGFSLLHFGRGTYFFVKKIVDNIDLALVYGICA